MKLDQKSLKHIKLCLQQLSDTEYQERVWVRGEGPEVSSYTEVVCQLFDDTALGDLLSSRLDEPVLSEELDSILLALSKIFDEIDYKLDIQDILMHPEWNKVKRLSSKALKLL